MASYLCVLWRHNSPNDPVRLCSELDDGRWEIRKVEIFADGRMGYADASGGVGGTQLGQTPIPPETEIASDPQFEIAPMLATEFEAAWNTARMGRGLA